MQNVRIKTPTWPGTSPPTFNCRRGSMNPNATRRWSASILSAAVRNKPPAMFTARRWLRRATSLSPMTPAFRGSGGAPRWVEDPTQRVEDISRVIDYAVTLPYVDAERIGVLGICGGGGYAVNATLTEKRIKAVVSITGVNIGRLFREGFSGYDPLAALNAMAAQRTKRAAASFRSMSCCPPALRRQPPTGSPSATFLKPRTTTRPRAASSRGGDAHVVLTCAKTLAWDAFAFAEVLLTQPVMVVVGRKSVPLAPIAMGWKSTGVQRLRSIVSWFRWRISHTTSCMTNRKPFVKRWTRCCRFRRAPG